MSSRLPRPLVLFPIAATLACNPNSLSLYGQGNSGIGMSAMTQDLGLGGDLQAVLAAAPADQPALADTLWAQKDTASFATRVGAIADGIKLRAPDIIGLQSAMQWRHTAPGSATEELVSDYLDLLAAALQARGLAYAPVASVTTADLTLTGAAGDQYRVTDREAILVRTGVATVESTSGTYVAQRTVSVGGAAVAYPRGWVAAQLSVNGKSFHVVSTHLDSVDPTVQGRQAAELVKIAGTGPALVMGNLGADAENPAWTGYAVMIDLTTGMFDLAAYAGAAFPTCCRDPALVDPSAQLARRNDVILGTQHFQAWTGVTVNGGTSGMVNGLWPSRDAGVVTAISMQ
jgi:endonuclease/exonuclease/phosphatase family metal-dependent hydrolase